MSQQCALDIAPFSLLDMHQVGWADSAKTNSVRLTKWCAACSTIHLCWLQKLVCLPTFSKCTTSSKVVLGHAQPCDV
jgi:hypothetical protein